MNAHELASNAIIMTTSLVFYAVVFANLASTVETNNVVLNGFKADIDPVKQFMKVNRIEPILKSRITIFFDYLYIRQSGMTDDQILSELPKALRRGISNRALGLLGGVPFFKPDLRPPEFLYGVGQGALGVRGRGRALWALCRIRHARRTRCLGRAAARPCATAPPAEWCWAWRLCWGDVEWGPDTQPTF